MTNKQMTAQEQIAMLREALIDAETRMTRARRILTDGNPRPGCNWGMLDTSSVIMPALDSTNQPPEAEVDERAEFQKWFEKDPYHVQLRKAPYWVGWQARAALKGGK